MVSLYTLTVLMQIIDASVDRSPLVTNRSVNNLLNSQTKLVFGNHCEVNDTRIDFRRQMNNMVCGVLLAKGALPW